jgi:hypothetical protein
VAGLVEPGLVDIYDPLAGLIKLHQLDRKLLAEYQTAFGVSLRTELLGLHETQLTVRLHYFPNEF